MAEGYEETNEILIDALTRTYFALREAYRALPIPISLPQAFGSASLAELEEILIEAVGRIEDLPAHPVGAKALHDATYHWIAAVTTVQAFKATSRTAHSETAAWSLNAVADLTELALALFQQG